MPACHFDRYLLKAHKIRGGTFQNYSDKNYIPLTSEQIERHIEGVHFIGVYPLLQDNTSWFIAADFDGEKWKEESKAALNCLQQHGLPAYLERSRSGNGGHIWIFFQQAYPAIKSRKILLQLLQESGVVSVFDKTSSFDRLFPNQDFLSGKGFGNLIALPLHKHMLEQGNGCFIDAETFEPFNDQWGFLKNIRKASIAELDTLYSSFSNNTDKPTVSGKLEIRLHATLSIARNGLPIPLINFLKEELNFLNTEFIIKKKMGRNTWNTERYFRYIEETEDWVNVPKGMIGRVLRFCRENKLEYDFKDERNKHKICLFNFTALLREYQLPVVDAVSKKDIGVIVAPPGAGKTIMALKIIAGKQQPALIIVHIKQLAEQWIERIQSFLGIPRHEIGKIAQGKSSIGKSITVATLQSLSKVIEKQKNDVTLNAFGTVIIDECHHIPAATYRNVISKLNSFYLYGLTATPFRKYNDGKLIFIHLGEVIAEVKAEDIGNPARAKIVIRNTDFEIPFNSKTDKFETLSKILVHDSHRNKFILKDVIEELKNGKKAVVITERKEHIDVLHQLLKQSFETISLSGGDTEADRNRKWKLLKAGNYQVLITTGQYFGEGSDLQNAQCLFLVYPFSFQGKLIQYIGRVQRSELTPVIYDYRDYKISYLNKLFLKRNVYYRKIEQIPSLFDEPQEEPEKEIITINRKIKIPVEELEFGYGTIAFKYMISEVKAELEFEIENTEIRPEFDVLKPFFVRLIKSKNITVDIFAEFENGNLVSHLAQSAELERLNREAIESVKYRFIENMIGKRSISGENLPDVNQLQGAAENKGGLYHSGEELLEDILNTRKVKHYQQLRYLAQKHEHSVMKLRFALSPFSFIFLLSGNEHFHVVMETLDTEEATYLWHFDRNRQLLRQQLKLVDDNLNTIRNKGRQAFLQSAPLGFSKILHDYTNERKGFILWKDVLEERLS